MQISSGRKLNHRRARQANWKGMRTRHSALPNLLRPSERSSYVSRNEKFSMSASRPTREVARRSDESAGRSEQTFWCVRISNLIAERSQLDRVRNHFGKNDSGIHSEGWCASEEAAVSYAIRIGWLVAIMLLGALGTIYNLRQARLTWSLRRIGSNLIRWNGVSRC